MQPAEGERARTPLQTATAKATATRIGTELAPHVIRPGTAAAHLQESVYPVCQADTSHLDALSAPSWEPARELNGR